MAPPYQLLQADALLGASNRRELQDVRHTKLKCLACHLATHLRCSQLPATPGGGFWPWCALAAARTVPRCSQHARGEPVGLARVLGVPVQRGRGLGERLGLVDGQRRGHGILGLLQQKHDGRE